MLATQAALKAVQCDSTLYIACGEHAFAYLEDSSRLSVRFSFHALVPDWRLPNQLTFAVLGLFTQSSDTKPAEGALVARLQQEEESSVHAVAFSPDGQYIVVGCGDKSVKVWSLTEQLQSFSGHEDTVQSVAVTTDGRAVSCSHDKTLRVWRLPRHPFLYAQVVRECNCNCTCEVAQAICPEGPSWIFEPVKGLIVLLFGILAGTGQFLEVIFLGGCTEANTYRFRNFPDQAMMEQLRRDAAQAAAAMGGGPQMGAAAALPVVAGGGRVAAGGDEEVWARVETADQHERGEIAEMDGFEILHGTLGLKTEGGKMFFVKKMKRFEVDKYKGAEATGDARLLVLSFQGIHRARDVSKEVKEEKMEDWSATIFAGAHKEYGDVMVAPSLLEYVAKEVESEAAVLKQVRKAREERAAANK
eukprot:s3339_g4.t1